MILGYARVSTAAQSLFSQTDALKQYGCKMIYEEKTSAPKERPELDKLLGSVSKGDILAVTKMDRLARSTRDMLRIARIIQNKEADMAFLDQSIDTSTPQGKLMFTMLSAFAEFEHDIISNRTRAGLEAARVRGRNGGRPATIDKLGPY
jgi:DNA invertase Pin-like site-specific DNA recombinase